MDHLASIAATPTTQPARIVQAGRPAPLWVLAATATIIAGIVLLADAALSPVQRIDVFVQAGTYP